MLKTLIIFVVVLLLISLGASLVFLLLDQGKTDSKRTVYALGARVTFAVILILLVIYGLYTGELGNSVPWQR
ncbi:DUF2909 domain-containing protein [bacterium]|jgi:uncharacterized BrkB/YihY/UPF0761 family membrane protein|nr:DUF2909 domain-containing protein [bacterium]MDA9997003.1 DUF2909 domain-containing protein [Gammaproteobacteria bacterium]MDC1124286.1 DUF2909 domain-containing protein [Gammaproteobacteria bacterium]MDC3248002.1 DUF2909 domain-containing protein [Gammaproteobacteria bacterium]MDC3302468.1 DUF2909 domain-containing protein [Gammaproteobacteria bacterium]|tara:strand:- start:100 stop:315 length:216 start_codon:yes stop_codon:yes gene_type:complete